MSGDAQTTGGQDGVKIYHMHNPFPDVAKEETISKTTGGNVFRSTETELGRESAMTTCSHCQTQVMTTVTYKAGSFAWIMCFVLIFCGFFLGCCLIPFFIDSFKDAYHLCPRCKRVLYVCKKKCCD